MLRPTSQIAKTYHADPEARYYAGKYYIYATKSRPYRQQQNIDLYVSDDGAHWQEIRDIIDMDTFPYVRQAVWAPSVIEKGGRYYLIFACNDIQSDEQDGGLEIAVSDTPEGPFRNLRGTHLIGRFHNGAQPIDAHFFKDDDGTVYLFYGGWGHCNVAVMDDDMKGVSDLREITPDGYCEAPCMFRENGRYYFMYSAGSWTDDTYRVVYGVTDHPLHRVGETTTILQTDKAVAKAPGHNGYLKDTDGRYYCVYHRRPLNKRSRHARILAIDRMDFTADGRIAPIAMTPDK